MHGTAPLSTLGLNTPLTSRGGGTDPPAKASSSGAARVAGAGAIQGAACPLARTCSSDKERDSRRGGTLSYAQKYPPRPPPCSSFPGCCREGHAPSAGAPAQEKKAFFFSFFQGKDSSEASEMFKPCRQLPKIRDKCLKGQKGLKRVNRGWGDEKASGPEPWWGGEQHPGFLHQL